MQSERPLDLSMNLFTIFLWNKIALETDEYRQQQGWVSIRTILSTEVMVFTGLLTIRSLNPWTNSLKNRWRVNREGLLLFGCFWKLH